MGSDRRREVRDDSRALGLSNWKNGITFLDGEVCTELVLKDRVGVRETQGLGF